jgi:hypothetical protein
MRARRGFARAAHLEATGFVAIGRRTSEPAARTRNSGVPRLVQGAPNLPTIQAAEATVPVSYQQRVENNRVTKLFGNGD